MSRAAKRDNGASWFVVDDDAARATVDAAIRGALHAQRDRLHTLHIDLVSDRDWPAEALDAVRRAERRLPASRRGGISLTLDPRLGEDFRIALDLAPVSIGGTGTSHDGAPIWDANDTGTSAAFALYPAEELAVRRSITDAGGDPAHLVRLESHRLAGRALTYDVVGATAPDAAHWQPPAGWRAYERTVHLGSGAELWDAASAAVLSWGVKTRSGFAVVPPVGTGRAARRGHRRWLVARIGPLRVREPVEVVATVSTETRAALAYGTLDGHPVSGEEAFIVHRDDDGVRLTLRSLTHAGWGLWRVAFPLILIAQRVYRRRYLRALRPS